MDMVFLVSPDVLVFSQPVVKNVVTYNRPTGALLHFNSFHAQWKFHSDLMSRKALLVLFSFKAV